MTHGSTEDLAWVGETGISDHVSAGSYEYVIRALESSPVEPRIVGRKLYAPGAWAWSPRRPSRAAWSGSPRGPD